MKYILIKFTLIVSLLLEQAAGYRLNKNATYPPTLHFGGSAFGGKVAATNFYRYEERAGLAPESGFTKNSASYEKRVRKKGMEIFANMPRAGILGKISNINWWRDTTMFLGMKWPVTKKWLMRKINEYPDMPRYKKLFHFWFGIGLWFVARRFITGWDMKSLIKNILKLRGRKIGFTADILGEAVKQDEEAERNKKQYIALIEKLADRAPTWDSVPILDKTSRMNISLKLTGLTPQLAREHKEEVKKRLREILRKAVRHSAFVTIDMEEYCYKDVTLEIYKELLDEEEFEQCSNLQIVIQVYLVDSPKDIKEFIEWAKRRHGRTGAKSSIRLVKGAYWDKEKRAAEEEGRQSPVWGRKWQTDRNYDEMAALLLKNTQFIETAFATHNAWSMANVIYEAERNDIPKDEIEFQMLYGMGEPFQEALVKLGYRVRAYLPCGPLLKGIKYFSRRIDENTSQESFLLQSLSGRYLPQELLKAPGLEKKMPDAFKKFHPISDILAHLNYLYYNLRGVAVFDKMDFFTLVSHNPLTAYVNAEEFYGRLQGLQESGRLPEAIIIREWGIGNGGYASDFLDKLLELDAVNGTDFYRKIRYVLGDFSEKMLSEAREKPHLKKHEAVTKYEVVDADDLSGIEKGSTLLVRFNELYDDMPGNELLYKKGDKFYRVMARLELTSDFTATRKIDETKVTADEFIDIYWNGGIEKLAELDLSFMRDIRIKWEERREEINLDTYPYGRFIKEWAKGAGDGMFPVNMGAISNLRQAFLLLDRERDGYIQFFDYGFLDNKFIAQTPDIEKIWRPAGQPTVYVNFPLLRYVAETVLGIHPIVETQSDYITRMKGERVIGRELLIMMSGRKLDELLPGFEDLEEAGKIRRLIASRNITDSGSQITLLNELQSILGWYDISKIAAKIHPEAKKLDNEIVEAIIRSIIVRELHSLAEGCNVAWLTRTDILNNKAIQKLLKPAAIQRMADSILALENTVIINFYHMRVDSARADGGLGLQEAVMVEGAV